jgi:cysteine-rich repeat protein
MRHAPPHALHKLRARLRGLQIPEQAPRVPRGLLGFGAHEGGPSPEPMKVGLSLSPHDFNRGLRRLAPLVLLAASSCSLFVRLAGPGACADGDALCVENSLLLCEGGLFRATACLDSVCDPVAKACGVCGDDILDPTEACDEGAENSDLLPDACRTDCQLARCGDGVVDAAEECDDANADETDGCRADCTVFTCQNGAADPGELCPGAAEGLSLNATTIGALAAGDFEGDGDIDLAAVDVSQNKVSVLLNDGAGAFARLAPISVGSDPIAIAAGDWNGDGFLDLAVANRQSDDVSVLLNNQDGSFSQGIPLSLAGAFFAGIAAGDFNGDAFLDLALSNRGATPQVVFFLGNGQGAFFLQTAASVLIDPDGVALADFNGDAVLDFASTSFNVPGNVDVQLNNGALQFFRSSSPQVGIQPQAIVVGDLDADGKPDWATVNLNSDDVHVGLNADGGLFSIKGPFAVGDRPQGLALGDLDGDLDLDLVVSNVNDNNLSLLLNDGTGSFTAGAGNVSLLLAAP